MRGEGRRGGGVSRREEGEEGGGGRVEATERGGGGGADTVIMYTCIPTQIDSSLCSGAPVATFSSPFPSFPWMDPTLVHN